VPRSAWVRFTISCHCQRCGDPVGGGQISFGKIDENTSTRTLSASPLCSRARLTARGKTSNQAL